ncbi:MAG: TIR domain-containing protein, partial [Saprospiraceae bacterium]|nr:TIR domain-containing protein [Saprospiraceae bacterium]
KDYLNVGDHDHNFFLVGAKGTGKTLFLNFKSYLYNYHLKEHGLKKHPSNQLCENLIIYNETFSKDDLIKFSTSEIWTKVWTFTLMCVACKTGSIELPEPVKNLIGRNTSVSSILTNILTDRGNVHSYFKYIPELMSYLEEIQNGVVIFIDNVDQCFKEFLEDYHYKDENGNKISIDVWLNAQFGLVSSVYQINQHNNHVKIYTTVRGEVFHCVSSQLIINYKGYSTFLNYTKSEVREIFEKNILLMERHFLFDNIRDDLIGSFFGFSEMRHVFAKDKFKRKRIEKVFDFIYRHTFGRPRELVFLGSELFNNVTKSHAFRVLPTREKIEKIRWEANKISNELFDHYKQEIIPSFNNEELVELLEIVQCNVIPSDFIGKNLSQIIKKYYAMGLIGHVLGKHDGNDVKYTQIFLPPAEYSYKDQIKLPNSKYYITHPSLDETFKALFGIKFYNKFNIIGKDYDFFDIPYMSKIYDVAFSFAGENRAYVEATTSELINMGVRVFYDNHEKTGLWGKDLFQHLDKIYRYYAKFCVVFISKSYSEKGWTNHELKSAQAREFDGIQEYILPVRFDNTELPGLRPTIAYQNANKLTPKELAYLIKMKVKNAHNHPPPPTRR